MTNPYGFAAPRRTLTPVECSFADAVAENLRQQGFRLLEADCESGIETHLWWKRFSWLLVPTVCYFYVKHVTSAQPIDVATLRELDRCSLRRTSRLEPFPSWLRIQVPMTLTVILCDAGFSAEAVSFVESTKPDSQSGQPHGFALVDPTSQSLHLLRRTGPSVNFKNAHDAARRALTHRTGLVGPADDGPTAVTGVDGGRVGTESPP